MRQHYGGYALEVEPVRDSGTGILLGYDCHAEDKDSTRLFTIRQKTWPEALRAGEDELKKQFPDAFRRTPMAVV